MFDALSRAGVGLHFRVSGIICMLFLFACGPAAADSTDAVGGGAPRRSGSDRVGADKVVPGPSGVDPSIASMPVVKGRFINSGATTQAFELEVARTDAQREHGLMFRQSMDPGRGMLFVFDGDAPRSFWMKNTYIPLDMIFASSDGIVVGIVENAAPLTLNERRCDVPARFVIELNAFQAARHGIKVGS
ncbi:MAG TPA: DUF192 domain-containing protein, partial [Myxococcota bacterium]|nr:DUF192 domain-containing protein [Myxococcota bacterium]